MVQGTLASLRHFCPDVPICLIADGGVDVTDLQRHYDLHVIKTNALADPEMRALCHQSFYAKMAALWEGPFEFGVWLDADAILWGDLRNKLRPDCDFQIFSCNGVSDLKGVPSWLPHYQHNPDLLKKFDPFFDWRRNAYFCSGAFAFRKNVIPFEMWKKVHSWREKEKDLFGWGEMGMLNYCVHSLNQRGFIKLAVSDLQHLRSEQGVEELKSDNKGCGWNLPVKVARPRVLHFCGLKPFLHEWRGYSRPFTIARLEHHRRTKSEIGAWWAVWQEELVVLQRKILTRLRAMIRKRG